MNRTKTFSVSLALLLSALPAIAQSPEMNVIPSWGDIVIVHGRGIDAAMDSPDAIANIIDHWKGRGFTGVYLRTDLSQMDPCQLHRNNTSTQENARLAVLWKYVDQVMESFDVHATMQRIGQEKGFKYWAYHPHLFSDGAPENVGTPGPGRMVPWSYCMKYNYDHPDVVTVDRKGNHFYMVSEYGYPGVRTAKVNEFVYMAKKLGLKRFIADLRSEALQVQPAPDKADQYGFNEPVVADMKKLYGVDIMTDSRFDVYSPKYDPCDPMVQNWYNLRGEYFTQFLRELRAALRVVDPNIEIAIPLSGDHVGPPMGNWRLDWRKWVDEGLVDAIINPASFEATIDKDSASKGYLTNVILGKGTIPLNVISAYIKKSAHPSIKLIASGAPSYFYPPPPDSADGWRCDLWYDSYTLAWFQRWEQWKKDIADFGCIKFIEQNFDTFPVRGTGAAGGLGDGWHTPKLRACPGCWYKLGDGNDTRPIVQNAVKHGRKGNAVKLTCTTEGAGTLTGWHASAPDRSNYTDCLDNAITNGKASLEFWLYRESSASAIVARFQSEDYESDVGLRITPNSGAVAFSNAGKWVETKCVLPPQKWQKFTIALDCDRHIYSAFIGTNREKQLCSDVNYSIPKSRFVVMHGMEHLPIAVPAYRSFKLVQFIPEGAAGNVTYVDDVLVKWMPALYYTKPGDKIFLSDNFETHAVRSAINDTPADTGAKWKVVAGPDNFVIENGTSYGAGVKCLRAPGGSTIRIADTAPLALAPHTSVTLDFDIFVRSDDSFPYILPNPTTKSDHRTTVSLETEPNRPLAAITAGDGTWLCWDGTKYVDSGARIAYDVWNHVQLALDTSTRTCRVVVCPLGELPKLIATQKYSSMIDPKVYLSISPSKSLKGFSCYDNISVRYGSSHAARR